MSSQRCGFLLAALAALLVGCAGAELAPDDALVISGVYMDDHDDLVGKKHEHLIFTFDEVNGKIDGGVRILYRDNTGHHVSKARHTTIRDVDGLITGSVELGGTSGRATFSGRFSAEGFAYTFQDGVETLHGVAEYAGPYLKPAGRGPDDDPDYWTGAFFEGSLGASMNDSQWRYEKSGTWDAGEVINFRTRDAHYDNMGGLDITPQWNLLSFPGLLDDDEPLPSNVDLYVAHCGLVTLYQAIVRLGGGAEKVYQLVFYGEMPVESGPSPFGLMLINQYAADGSSTLGEQWSSAAVTIHGFPHDGL